MNFFKIVVLTLLLFTFSFATHAQPFLKRQSEAPLSFKEMQVQFHNWKNSVDLKKQKNWKSFKRWEMETQLHTDAQGNPVAPELYISEILKAAKAREQSRSQRSQLANPWIPSGPFNLPVNLTGYLEVGMGRINCIAFHPTDSNTYFVGVAQGGLWKTSNNGQSWTPLTDNLPITRISDIAIDPNNTNIMYISVGDFEYIDFGLKLNGRKRNTHYGLGLYKTMDGGLTWQATGLSFQLTNGDASLLRKTIVHPTNSNKLVSCGASGMYLSNDAGATWTKNLDSLFWDMVQDPVNPNILYAASGWLLNANVGNAAIYKSTDFGVSWTMLNTGIPATGAVQRIKLAIAPSNNNYIYALTVDVNRGFYGFYKTTDAGVNWTFLPPALNVLEGGDGTNSGGQGTYDLGLAINAGNPDVLYTGGVNLWGSVDGAQTFNPVSHWTTAYGPTTHADIHFIERQNSTGKMFVCNDGGVYSANAIVIHNWADANSGIPWPTVWTKLNDGLQITSFYRLSSSRNSSGKLVAGAQDNSTYFYDGSNWSNIFGGDGMDNYINPANDSNVIGSSQYGNFYMSYDNGVSDFGCFPNVNGEVAEWTTPIVADYNTSGTLYAGFSNVVKSTDGGSSWNAISSFPVSGLADNEISALAVANSNSNVIYAAKRVRYEYTAPGSLFRTLDGGSTWLDVTSGIPDSLYYTSVEINDTNAAIAYVSMAGFSAGNKIFRTLDNGATWQNISYNLANLPVNCVKSLPGGHQLLAATDIGIFKLEDNAVIWQNISSGLPNVITSDIEINVALNKIYIATFGRGIWETDLDAILASPYKPITAGNFELFPSLNTGTFTIQFAKDVNVKRVLKLEVIDIMGRIVETRQLSNSSNTLHLKLVSGKYFAKISGDEFYAVKSFIIE